MSYALYTHPHKKICLVDMNQESSHHFSDVLINTISSYIQKQKKILIINNKKGYATGMICRHCGFIPKCTHCDIPIALCLDNNQLQYHICHICKTLYTANPKCTVCHSNLLFDFGMGNQKIAQWLSDSFAVPSLVIDNKHTSSIKKINTLTYEIHKYNIIIGTSLLSRPIQGRSADLIVVYNTDIGLHIPDFNVDQKQFYFLYELLTTHQTTNYILQTHNPTHHAIASACNLDYIGFNTHIQTYLAEHQYPPYGELCVIMYKHEIEERLFTKINTLYQELLYFKEKEHKDLEIYATPPLIYKIYNTYRYHIIIKGIDIKGFVDQIYDDLELRRKGFRVDWMPISVLG